jgi:hypothetical protein
MTFSLFGRAAAAAPASFALSAALAPPDIAPGGTGKVFTQGKPSRFERINDIRCQLLVDRDRDSGTRRLGLIDSHGFVSERELAEHNQESRLPIRDALAALVARRVLSVIPGKGYEVALLTKDVIDRNNEVGYDTVEGLCTELRLTANAAIENISTVTSQQERRSLLGEAQAQLESAAKKSKSNSASERGEAVCGATETISLLGSAAGLRWGADTLRSGLDILEISSRWNCDQAGKDVFELPSVVGRVKTCQTLIEALAGDRVATEKATDAFSAYLGDRVEDLSISLGVVGSLSKGAGGSGTAGKLISSQETKTTLADRIRALQLAAASRVA